MPQDRASTLAPRNRPTPRFAHNLRLWALAGPCLGVLLLLGGRPTALVAAFGVMACYCFDIADNAEGAMLTLWVVVVCCAGTLAWAGSALGVPHVLVMMAFVALMGVWSTLQFGSVFRDEPDLARFLERLLFACFPLPAVAILTWAGVALGGAAYAAPCVALLMYAAVGLYAVPLRSALGRGGAGGVHGDSSRSGTVLCACMLVLPAMVQIAVDHRLLVFAEAAARQQSLLKVWCAAALPWPLLLSLRPRGLLWWAAPELRRRLDKILVMGSPLALLIVCETTKSLVLLPTFRPFLHSAPHPPWDALLASAALYCLVAAWLVQSSGGNKGLYAARALMVASVRCLGLLLGVEQVVMPLLDVSAVALSTLIFSGRRDLTAYIVGVAGVSSLILWFLCQTVWHLSFSFELPLQMPSWDAAGGSGPRLSLQKVAVFCPALSLGVLLLPGLAVFGVRQAIVGIVFGLHTVLLLLLEMAFIGTEVRNPWELEGLYPLPLTAVTGFLGAWMAARLFRDRGVDTRFLWVPASVNAAKVLTCVVAGLAPTHPESSAESYISTVIPITALVLTSMAPFALFKPRSGTAAGAIETHTVSGGARVEAPGTGAADDWSGPMLPIEAFLCVFFMANALWVCSRPVIYPLLMVPLGGGGGVGHRRNESASETSGHVLAFCGVILALYSLAMVSRHFPESQTGRRSGAALLVASVALLVLQPALVYGAPRAGGAVGESWKESLKEFCGIVVAGAGVLALAGVASPTKTLARRAAFAVTIGFPVGAWSALASMPGADAAAVSLSAIGAAGTYTCAMMVLLETALPRPAVVLRSATRGAAKGVLPELYVAVVAFMPVAGVAQGVYLLVFGPVGRRLLSLPATNRASAQGALHFALTTAATGHAVIALALRLAQRAASGGGAGAAGIGRRGTMQRPMAPPVGEARWIPVMGNASTICAAVGTFLSCWVHLPGESARALAAIPSCALLFLLQEDGRILRGTGFQIAVPLGALAATWTGSAAYYILVKGVSTSGYTIPFFLFGGLLGQAAGAYRGGLHHFHGVFGAVDSRRHGEAAVALRAVSFWTADSPWQPLWNLALLAVSLPSQAQFSIFLWGGQGSSQRAWQVLAALAINVLPLVAGDLASTNLLGLVGLVGGAAHIGLMRERQATGRRFI